MVFGQEALDRTRGVRMKASSREEQLRAIWIRNGRLLTILLQLVADARKLQGKPMESLSHSAEPAISASHAALDAAALEQLFLAARTHNGFAARPVDDATLRRLYELARMPPTAANSQPGRVYFVKSAEAKEKLRPTLSAGNLDKTMAAPVTAIVAYDTQFHEQMPKLFPARPEMGKALAAMPQEARDFMMLQNGSLQAAYLIIAARALGLDCGPMGGFDHQKVDAAFFSELPWKSIVLINLGYGDPSKLHPRNPRLSFDEACRIG
jgi:3-hydroxypropanoate dehydrogenase